MDNEGSTACFHASWGSLGLVDLSDGGKYAMKPEKWRLHPEIRRLRGCLERVNANRRRPD